MPSPILIPSTAALEPGLGLPLAQPGMTDPAEISRKGLEPLTLQADFFKGAIEPRVALERFHHYNVLCTNPLILEPEKGRWVHIERFGAVVFWNCPERLIQSIQEELKGLPGLGPRVDTARDRLRVYLGATEDRAGFNEVWLRELSLDKLRIISLALAQSVALDFLEGAVREAMARFQPVVRDLSRRGRLGISHREALRLVGFALEARATVLESLTLFDDPPETWESEALAYLDQALFDQFDLEERIGAVNQKLTYLADAGARLMDVLNNRKNHRLEWIVIILIAVEVVAFFWKELFNAVIH